jgi:hypothetical protein
MPADRRLLYQLAAPMPLIVSDQLLAVDNAKLPFAEQIAFFQSKLGEYVASEAWDEILKAAHDQAFTVAGATKADLLADLYAAVKDAISGGGTIQQFRQDFDAIVEKHGWAYNGPRAWRTRVIYQTNMATSYSAGRWAQLQALAANEPRTLWKYVHNDTVAHPRPLHVSWSGLTLKPDDPFWKTHFPPNGWGCRCRVTAVLRPSSRTEAPDDGTWEKVDRWGEIHTIPKGIDYGWDYAPGASTWQPDLRSYPKPIAIALKSDLASREK